jgi:Protein of unknown function (DUF3147)
VTAVQDKERPITARIAERPALDVGKLREVRPRDLAIRFVAGALTSIAAGLLTLAFGARVGGILLAFPAILGASLTLIEDQEDSIEAREDARGAVVGGCALALFAAIAATTLGHINPVLAVLLATAAWFAGALLGYLLAWVR